MVLKVVIALILLAHGIGHSLGIIGALGMATANPSWDGRSWILSGPVPVTAATWIGLGLWAVAMVGFVIAAGVVMGWLPATWWQPIAVVSSVASLAGIVLFPAAFPVASTIGALVVDVIVLGAVLWAHWAPSDLAS